MGGSWSLMSLAAHVWNCVIYSGLPLFFWVRPRWSTADLTSQEGKVVIVTGGNSGTGYETCKALYHAGAKVYLACRDLEKGRKAIDDIKRGGEFGILGVAYPAVPPPASRGHVECLKLDLADFASISAFMDEFKTREKRVDLLFANAGVMVSPEGMRTKQGYALQFGTNCLGHQRLISLLLPLLLETSRTSPHLARVISTSSAGHSLAPYPAFNPKQVILSASPTRSSEDGKPRRGEHEPDKWVAYGQSKWGNVALARYLHWRYGPDAGRAKRAVVEVETDSESAHIISIAVHPGLIATNLAQHLSLTPYVFKWAPWIRHPITKPAPVGASNQLWAATCSEEEARKLSGEYIVPFQRIGIARPDLDNAGMVQKLWNWCEEQGRKHR